MESTVKYPIGVQSFEVLREDGFLYVDKTALIHKLAQQHICFLCRPRRFGKSLTISTLEAYFKGKKSLFEGLAIMSLEKEWKRYPIFHLDFNGVQYKTNDDLIAVLETNLQKWETEYGRHPQPNAPLGYRFAYVIEQASLKTEARCAVLVDEYDKPLLDVLGEPAEDENRETLRGFFSVFKLVDAKLRFVLLTGVTKFSQVSVFSGFNQPYDISMSSEYECICGITEEELHGALQKSVESFASKIGQTPEVVYKAFKAMYDGYHFSPAMTDIYNPFSLFSAFNEGNLRNFWFSTGTPTYLLRLINEHNVDMSQLLDEEYRDDYFMDYRANSEEPLAMLYQSGYLTIKEVIRQQDESNLYRLDYPNLEVKRGFVTMLCNNYFASREDTGGVAQKIARCLLHNKVEEMHVLLDQFLSSIDYEMRKDKEYHFQYTLYLLFSLVSSFGVVVEQHNSQGRADLVVETSQFVYIFEFKLDGTADEALLQIEDRQYAKPFLTDKREIIKIGASFGRKSGTIDDWKVG